VQSSGILLLGVACSAGAVLAASRLNRGYIGTLEKSLINRAGGVHFPGVDDHHTRTVTTPVRAVAPAAHGDAVKAVAIDPNARPIPPRPPRQRRPAADFPANLFPWRRTDGE